MKVIVDSKDVIKLECFNAMRKVLKSKATDEQKSIALNEIFYKANKMLDIEEGEN